jgi:hypothetical protein
VLDDPHVHDLNPKPKIDTTIPHSARIWNYWLGGKDNYPVDQAAGDEYIKTFPRRADTRPGLGRRPHPRRLPGKHPPRSGTTGT